MNYYEFINAVGIEVLWQKHYRLMKRDYYNIVYDLNGVLQRKVIKNPEEEKDFEHWIHEHSYRKPLKDNPEWVPETCDEQGTIIYVKGDQYILRHTGKVEKVSWDIASSLDTEKEYYFGINVEEEYDEDDICTWYIETKYICEDGETIPPSLENMIWRWTNGEKIENI